MTPTGTRSRSSGPSEAGRVRSTSGRAGRDSMRRRAEQARFERAGDSHGLGPDFVLGSRILEDLRGTGFIRARTNGSANNLPVDFTLLTGSFAFQGSAGAPPSRGAACAALSASGTDAFKAPGALTGGDFGGTYTSSANSTGVVLDLVQIRSVSLVVVRGCSGQCPVAAGSDLSSLQEVSTAVGAYWGLAPARSARYVRVMGSTVSL